MIPPAEVVRRLRGCCIDYDGSEEADGAPPVLIPSCAELREAASIIEQLSDADEAAKRWYEAASPCGTPDALRECLQLYKKALKMIAEFSGSIGDRPMRTDEKLSWAQEFAREALQGIDPTTGKT